jgi:hypothetical protein
MATKSVFKRFDAGTSTWVEFYFRTSADIIDETSSFKVMTAAERTAIATYLTGGFNTANKLLQLDSGGLIPASLIPTNLAAYLKTNNPTFTGTLTGPLADITRVNFGATSENIQSTQNGLEISSQLDVILKAGGAVDVNSKKITSLATPTAASDAANKSYVDNLVAEGVKPVDPVVAATTANITLSGAQTIDGIAVTTTQRVLVKNQTTASQNGIYVVNGGGAWTKLTLESVKGTLVFVLGGTTNNDTKFYASTDTTWVLFSKTDTITAGAGLTRTGDTVSISNLGVTNAMIANTTIDLANKTALFAAVDDRAYASTGAANANSNIVTKLGDIYSAVKNLRGTTNYNTSNTETIAGAYTLANSKNATYTGSAATPTGTFNTGDLYFQTL